VGYNAVADNSFWLLLPDRTAPLLN